MKPIGKDDGGRKRNPTIQGERAYGRLVHRYPGRGCGASHPLVLRKMKAKDRVRDTKARGGSFTPVPKTPAIGPSVGVRPRVKSGDDEGTTAKARKYGPSEILTPFRPLASEPA